MEIMFQNDKKAESITYAVYTFYLLWSHILINTILKLWYGLKRLYYNTQYFYNRYFPISDSPVIIKFYYKEEIKVR